jgi:hypothetical protein
VLESELAFVREAVSKPKSFTGYAERARRRWQEDFVPVTLSQRRSGVEVQEFSKIWKFARTVADAIEIKTINFGSPDILDYSGAPKRYVVVGGNRLSRGLTLEGLSVSVFTRDAKAYDTLLQMGRWFGFRPAYHDLTRIFVEDRMGGLFADLARVELDLRADLSKYAHEENAPAPADIVPRIRAHPSLAVTSVMKMGAGRPTFSYQGTVQSTVSFPKTRDALLGNIEAGRSFISSLGEPTLQATGEGTHIWKDRSAEQILRFLESYTFGEGASSVRRSNLVSYIRAQAERGELIRWDVVIPKGNPNRALFAWTDKVRAYRIIRTPMKTGSISVLSSPGDIQQWKTMTESSGEDPGTGCLQLYLVDKDSGAGRETHFKDLADLLGLVFVFPDSHSNVTVNYVSQQQDR